MHEAHLHGLTLQVPSLPFQQQDQGLGACATTALWCALARVTRADGGRAVTPLDVARAAPTARGSLVTASTGLDLDQMTGTVRRHYALQFDPQHKGFEGFDEPVTVESAIVPLYPKIRITPEDLVAWVSGLLPVLTDLAGSGKLFLRVEMFYALRGDYLAGLGDVLTDSNRLGEIRRSASLSRYVWLDSASSMRGSRTSSSTQRT